MNKEKKKSVIKKIKKEYIIVAMLCLIAVYFVFSIGGSLKGQSKKNVRTESDYATILEIKLKDALSKVSGAGNVAVKISLSGTVEKVYATNETITETSSNKTVKKENVVVGGDLVEIGEIYPQITGVLIVSSGANSLTVRQNLMEAVVTFLNVDSSKVIILNGKK